METYRYVGDRDICAEEQPMLMTIAVSLMALGCIGLGVVMIEWYNDRKGL